MPPCPSSAHRLSSQCSLCAGFTSTDAADGEYVWTGELKAKVLANNDRIKTIAKLDILQQTILISVAILHILHLESLCPSVRNYEGKYPKMGFRTMRGNIPKWEGGFSPHNPMFFSMSVF